MSDMDDLEQLQMKLLDREFDDEDPQVFVHVSEPCQGFSKPRLVESPKSGHCCSSCCCCCLKVLMWTAIVCLLLISLVVVGAIFWTRNVVQHMTVTDSQTFPIVTMSDAEIDLVSSRVKVFVDELLLQKEPETDLIVTQDELNGFLGHSDYLRGNMYITLTEGKVLEEYSLPMDMLPGGKGRFFLGHDYTTIDEKAQRVEMKMETAAKHEDWFVGPLYFFQLHFEGKEFDEYDHQHLLELVMENGKLLMV